MGYSKKKEYDREIKELVKTLLLRCDKHKIPIFISLAVEDDGRDTKYVTEMLSAANLGVSLKKDNLVKFALVTSGFDVVPERKAPIYEQELEVVGSEE